MHRVIWSRVGVRVLHAGDLVGDSAAEDVSTVGSLELFEVPGDSGSSRFGECATETSGALAGSPHLDGPAGYARGGFYVKEAKSEAGQGRVVPVAQWTLNVNAGWLAENPAQVADVPRDRPDGATTVRLAPLFRLVTGDTASSVVRDARWVPASNSPRTTWASCSQPSSSNPGCPTPVCKPSSATHRSR